MIEFHTANTSNGQRAAIVLAECGLPFRVYKLDLAKGEQQSTAFLKLNPAGQVPLIVDPDGPDGKPLTLSQSGAIELYLAEKTGKFLPKEPARRALAYQWFMQALTDCAAASFMIFLQTSLVPGKSPANVAFYEQRLLRFLRLADARLAGRIWLADELSIADFALYPVCVTRRTLIASAGDLPNLTRWVAALAARPGVSKGMQAAA